MVNLFGIRKDVTSMSITSTSDIKKNTSEGVVKQKNRRYIIDCAKQVILTKGISSTSIADIAEESKMGRKTIYNHFDSVEAISEDIFLNTIESISSSLENIVIDYSKAENGFEKIQIFFTNYLNTLFDLKEDVLFTVHYDYYFRTFAKKEFVSDVIELHQHSEIIEFVNQGIQDGSINLDPNKIEHTFKIMGLSLMSYVSRLFLRGHIIEMEMGISEESCYDFLELLLKSIQFTQRM